RGQADQQQGSAPAESPGGDPRQPVHDIRPRPGFVRMPGVVGGFMSAGHDCRKIAEVQWSSDDAPDRASGEQMPRSPTAQCAKPPKGEGGRNDRSADGGEGPLPERTEAERHPEPRPEWPAYPPAVETDDEE